MMAERSSRSRAREPSQRHTVPLDILVVDDDQATRLSLAYALTDGGHKVTEAQDGEEAIALVAERIFDVAILDVRLPKVDGLTIFRRLRQKSPSVAALLGARDEEEGKVVLVAGVTNDLIAKKAHAGNWVKAASATVGGSGGGRPDMAQAGGKHPEKLLEALDAGRETMVKQLSA